MSEALVLVAAPRSALRLAASLPLAGLCPVGSARQGDIPWPLFADVESLLRLTGASHCAFLSPYPALGRDLRICLERRVEVLCAGPPDLPGQVVDKNTHLAWGGLPRSSPLFRTLYRESRAASFGQPVYLRLFTGGGPSLSSAWWAACRALEAAEYLLGERPEVRVAAKRHGRLYHLALSACFAGGATAQLAIAPAFPEEVWEASLLGQGGLLTFDSAANTPALFTRQGGRLALAEESEAERTWLEAWWHRKDPPPSADGSVLSWQKKVRAAISLAASQGLPARLALRP